MTEQKVTMFFDAVCPFAWVTSRWLVEVEKVRDISVEWVPMSLSVLNEGRDLDPEYMKGMEAALAPAHVAAAIHAQYPEKLGAWYTAIGTKIHDEGAVDMKDPSRLDAVIAESLEEAGLPAELAETAHKGKGEEGSFEDQLRQTHAQAIELVGDDVGTPVVKLGDVAFFGPVLTCIPEGERAGELFDASVTLAGYPHFFELKRSRTEGPKAEHA